MKWPDPSNSWRRPPSKSQLVPLFSSSDRRSVAVSSPVLQSSRLSSVPQPFPPFALKFALTEAVVVGRRYTSRPKRAPAPERRLLPSRSWVREELLSGRVQTRSVDPSRYVSLEFHETPVERLIRSLRRFNDAAALWLSPVPGVS